MNNKLGMTKEQEESFFAPIVKFLVKNPDLFNKSDGERNEVGATSTTAELGSSEITIEQDLKLQTKSKACFTNSALAS